MKRAKVSASQLEKAVPSDPRDALPLLRHLITYGEVSHTEILTLNGASWANLLEVAGILEEAVNKIYHVSSSWLLQASQIDEMELLRMSCFSYPVYRHYLIGVLAQNFWEAGKDNLHSRLETVFATQSEGQWPSKR